LPKCCQSETGAKVAGFSGHGRNRRIAKELHAGAKQGLSERERGAEGLRADNSARAEISAPAFFRGQRLLVPLPCSDSAGYSA
jgi:hypothetical protein